MKKKKKERRKEMKNGNNRENGKENEWKIRESKGQKNVQKIIGEAKRQFQERGS